MRTADRGRGREGEALPTFEAGNDVVAGLTVLAEGTQGYLTAAAVDQFGPRARTADLGARREGGLARKPLRKIIHTMGWPLRTSASFGEFGGSFIYPMGDELVTVGFVAGLESSDVEFSVHDVLQEFKTHRSCGRSSAAASAWRGAKTITEGGYHSFPRRFNAPGLLLVGEERGLVNVPRLKACTTRSSREAGRGGRIPRGCSAARSCRGSERSTPTTSRCARAGTGRSCYEVRNMRQAFDKGFFVGGALASAMTVTRGRAPNGRLPTHPNAAAPLKKTGRASRYPTPDGTYIFDKLSSVFASGNRTRRQPNHPKVRRTVRRPVAEAWRVMPGARVRGRPRRRRRDGDRRDHAVELRPVRRDHGEGRSATPPEGGSGPSTRSPEPIDRGQTPGRDRSSHRGRRAPFWHWSSTSVMSFRGTSGGLTPSYAYRAPLAERTRHRDAVGECRCVPNTSCDRNGGSGSPRPVSENSTISPSSAPDPA